MAKREALVSAKELDLGWYGKDEGRTVKFEFLADGKAAGTLIISAARVRWKGRGKPGYKVYKTTELGRIFSAYDQKKRRERR